MDGPNPWEMDIKVFFPAPTFLFTVLKIIFPKWEKKKCFLGWEKWNKIKNIEYMTLNNIANINNHHPHVHFNENIKNSLVSTHCKWRETSSTTSLLHIRTSSTSGFRNGSVFTSTQHSNSISDVTRLVATEHVRNKYSIRESIRLKSVVVLIASI